MSTCDRCNAVERLDEDILHGWPLLRAMTKAHAMNAGEMGLGSSDCPSFVWPSGMRIAQDPTYETTEQQESEWAARDPEGYKRQTSEFIDAVEAMEDRFLVDPRTGKEFYDAMLAAGYDPDPAGPHGTRWMCWFMHRMATAIARSHWRRERSDGG